MDADTKDKVTIAGIITGALSAFGFVWTQWATVREFVQNQPMVSALAVAVAIAAAAFGIVRTVLHRRQMVGRVRRARQQSPGIHEP